MATTTTINHTGGDLHHQSTVTLHHLGSLTHLKADGDFYTYSISGDNSNDLILYANSAQSEAMDFLLDGNNGNGVGSSSSHESMANLLDEGLGTSLDGTDEIPTISSSAHSTLGRNDSGVFSGDEVTGTGGSSQPVTPTCPNGPLSSSESHGIGHQSDSSGSNDGSKKQWGKNVSPNRQGSQRCTVCGKTFSNASALTKHKLTHSDERKHACSMCGKAFKRQDHLNGHMLTHRNKKPFECSVKGCGKSYCDARSLRRHVESRHGHTTLPLTTIGRQTSTLSPRTPSSKSEHRVPKCKKKNKISQQSTNGNEVISSTPVPNYGDTQNILIESTEPCSGPFGSNSTKAIDPSKGSLPLGSKYVMVKLKDKLMMGSPDEESLLQQNSNNNNNNILMSPETIATILSNAIVQETTKLTNDLLKVGIPATSGNQSQLHQLLTQRASPITFTNSSSGSPGSTTPSMSISQENPIYSPNWVTEDNKDLTEFRAPETPDVISNTGKLSDPSILEIGRSSMQGFPGVVVESQGGKSVGEVVVVQPPALITDVKGGSRSGCSGTISSTSPALLKEQLELIHQIIQQAQEECINSSNVPTPKKGKPFKGKKASKTTSGGSSATSKSKFSDGFEDLSKFGSLVDDKPVECTICFRRFKNTPALNGHMRLHGGYFKGGKDSDGKRKDASSNCRDPLSSTLQTASVSVRALIEEKIIQKRNTTLSKGSGDGGAKGPVGSPILTCSILSSSGKGTSESQPSEECSSSSVLVTSSGISVQLPTFHPSTTVTTPETHSGRGLDEEPDETFRFIYSPQDNSEYLLKDLEEEVFNKVSSICPESFLDGIIDESILSGENGQEDLMAGTEWSWSSGSSTSNGGHVRLHSSVYGGDNNGMTPSGTPAEDSSPFYEFNQKMDEIGTPTTPLAPLDPNVFYMSSSPTPQSPSIKSQDSPSFPYPTPPASLEGHPTLQSPLFSFGGSTPTGASSFYGFDPLTSSCTTDGTTTINMMEIQEGGEVDCKIFPTPHTSVDEIVLSLGKAIKRDVNSLISIAKNFSEAAGGNGESSGTATGGGCEDIIKLESRGTCGGNFPLFPDTLQLLTPSSSPPIQPSSGNLRMEESTVNELKVNEVGQMEAEPPGNSSLPVAASNGFDPLFLNPNRVKTGKSSYLKSSKRKVQVRNTFASNLRQQAGSGTSSAAAASHYTPYPILSPVRSAPGLYWTFSNKLSHVEESKRESPRINVGLSFQATNLPEPGKRSGKGKASLFLPDDANGAQDEDSLLWNPAVVQNCSTDEVDKYLEFACCSAVPGGGRNKEYALHLLHKSNGDINAAIILLMNPNPQSHVRDNYKYPDNVKWTRPETITFQQGLLKHGKDFGLVANQLRSSKSRADCVNFYHLWKKICSAEYEKVRNVWKKREASFTLDLLKTVPPPTGNRFTSPPSTPTTSKERVPAIPEITMINNVPIDLVNGLSFQSHEEYPCKICRKIFTKVKSRSAHMKSHRPPDQQQQQQSTDYNLSPKKSKVGLPVMTNTTMPNSKGANMSPMSSARKPSSSLPPPLLEIPESRISSNKNKDT